MQTSIAQVVALTAYGNAYLLRQDAAADFYPKNSTFHYCEFVRFIEPRKESNKWEEAPIAEDPLSWFEELRNLGVDTLQMHYGPSGQKQFPDRMLVGFAGGGGHWMIECQRSGRSDFWDARWQVGDRTRPDRKIWRVTYGRIAANQPQAQAQRLEDLRRLSEEFDQHLVVIDEFATSQKLDNFSKLFRSARSRLHSDPPYSDLYHSDLALTRLMPVPACRLLAACQDAWVFGGMGSWNDQGFDKAMQPRYEALSETLYQLLNRAIAAATNSSAYGTFT